MGIKLKSKIFRNMFLMAAIFIVISVGVSTIILYKNIENRIVEDSKVSAEYVKYFIDKFGEESILSIDIKDGQRITLISQTGDVIYDSRVKSDDMENHMERPEVREALESGSGQDKRVSETLSETSYYYAVRLEDGNILRIATTSDAVYSTFKAIIPLTLIQAVFIITAAVIVSGYLTRKIVKPINAMDINSPENIVVYDELAPVVSRIRHQNDVIGRQLKDLRSKKIEFETITENMKEGLIVLGKRGQVISYNKSAIKLLDVDADEDVLRNALFFNRSSRFEKAVNNALSGKSDECVISFPDRICQIMANPVMDNEKAKGAVILIIDVTEKEKRESLRREFSANVSHELKTPLTSISGYAEIMKSGMVKGDDMIKFADIIYTEARRLINLVGDIIKVSKLDEDNVQLEETKVNIKELTEDIIKRLKPQADAKNVTIQENALESEQDVMEITGVSQIIDEMIYNVIDNAIKYNKDGGIVIVSIDGSGSKVKLEIKDTGIGIPKADIDRVFERFYRVDKSHSKEVGGTGLGLSIVKHSALFTGADIKLESEEGLGTTFTIEFKKNTKN
ncbi:MAG: ATP-binding protein [Lachnospiraceae bacterium]